MKLFGWKSAGRDVRPVLARYGLWSAGGSSGEWADDYAAQVRQGYCRNAVAQRAVRLIAQGLAGAPVSASSPELLALVSARSGGQALTETVAAHLLLHGIPRSGSIASGWPRWRGAPPVSRRRSRRITRSVAVIRPPRSTRPVWPAPPRRRMATCCCSRPGRRNSTSRCGCRAGSSMPTRCSGAWSSDRACRRGRWSRRGV